MIGAEIEWHLFFFTRRKELSEEHVSFGRPVEQTMFDFQISYTNLT